MTARTVTQTIRTYVVPVVVMTVVFALVLAFGPMVLETVFAFIRGVWSGVTHLVFNTDVHAVTGLGCWDEVKAGLPTEHLCGDVAHAAAGAVNFMGYPVS